MKIHPIRASLAITGWLATIAFLCLGIEIPDAWWSVVSGITVFYFATAED